MIFDYSSNEYDPITFGGELTEETDIAITVFTLPNSDIIHKFFTETFSQLQEVIADDDKSVIIVRPLSLPARSPFSLRSYELRRLFSITRRSTYTSTELAEILHKCNNSAKYQKESIQKIITESSRELETNKKKELQNSFETEANSISFSDSRVINQEIKEKLVYDAELWNHLLKTIPNYKSSNSTTKSDNSWVSEEQKLDVLNPQKDPTKALIWVNSELAYDISFNGIRSMRDTEMEYIYRK